MREFAFRLALKAQYIRESDSSDQISHELLPPTSAGYNDRHELVTRAFDLVYAAYDATKRKPEHQELHRHLRNNLAYTLAQRNKPASSGKPADIEWADDILREAEKDPPASGLFAFQDTRAYLNGLLALRKPADDPDRRRLITSAKKKFHSMLTQDIRLPSWYRAVISRHWDQLTQAENEETAA